MKNRGVKYITQYATPKYITMEESLREFVNTELVIWQIGDKFWKLADKYYGDSSFWWVIAWYNATPVEADLSLGDMIEIPISLNAVLDVLNLDY